MSKKRNLEDLAVLGGQPAFPEPLHVGRPNIGNPERFLGRIRNMLERRTLTNNGPYVQELEKWIALLIGVKHCIAMCNATVALEIAIRALGLKGEVLVPSMTFIATAHALQWQEITPVFCDIDPETHNLDPSRIEEMMTPRTTGIIGVHLWGRPCAPDTLIRIAQRNGLRLLFDAAHAFACSYKGRMIGSFGDAEVFSFHATKFFNTFEGGAVVTNDDDLADKIRLMRNFGFAGYDRVIYVGTNGKMSEASAAMGLTSLESLEEFIALNHRNYQEYQARLARIPGVKLISYDSKEKNNYQYIVVEIDKDQFGLSRDALVSICHAENILVRRYFYPGCHRMEPYRSYSPHARLLLPATERLVDSVLSFPTGSAIRAGDIDTICSILRMAHEHASVLQQRLDRQVTMSEPVM